jgi:hypothetical protein
LRITIGEISHEVSLWEISRSLRPWAYIAPPSEIFANNPRISLRTTLPTLQVERFNTAFQERRLLANDMSGLLGYYESVYLLRPETQDEFLLLMRR